MTVPELTPYTGLGGLHGGHWPAGTQAYGNPINGTNISYQGAAAAAQAQLLTYASYCADQARARFKSIEYTGIEAGEIIAWRCWAVVNNEALYSMFTNKYWSVDDPMTGDISTAGVHAWKEKMDAVNYGICFNGITVVGQVKLWGEVIEHEKGYTAENGRVHSIGRVLNGSMCKYKNNRLLKRLRGKYKIAQEAT